MTYLRNCWYVAGWSEELGEAPTLSRRLLDVPLVIFRSENGTVSALLDRCPHRFAPLGLGSVTNGVIACPYHGLGFGGDGRCIHNPHGPLSHALSVRTFPAEERHGMIWTWLGDPEKCNADAIPDLSFLDGVETTAYNRGYLHGQGHYQLYIDNILDLTHADYLHPSTLGGVFTNAEMKIEQSDGKLIVEWCLIDDKPMPFVTALTGLTGKVELSTQVQWFPASVMALTDTTVPRAGQGTGPIVAYDYHIMTPETATTTHYFHGSTRNFRTDDGALNRQMAEMRQQVFTTEDEPMIAAQFDRMEGQAFWDLKPALFRTDEAAVRVRRLIDKMIAAEQEG